MYSIEVAGDRNYLWIKIDIELLRFSCSVVISAEFGIENYSSIFCNYDWEGLKLLDVRIDLQNELNW